MGPFVRLTKEFNSFIDTEMQKTRSVQVLTPTEHAIGSGCEGDTVFTRKRGPVLSFQIDSLVQMLPPDETKQANY